MAKSVRHRAGEAAAASSPPTRPRYCSIAVASPRAFAAGLSPARLSLIQVLASKWVNGTVLKYCFVNKATFRLPNGTSKVRTWKLQKPQMDAVRAAFKRWKDLGIGISFEEVTDRKQADVRIGFLAGAGSWSYVGRDIRQAGSDELTMNLGWDVSNDIDTPTHEIGHTIGFPHEHQNPNAGIVWDEEAVYRDLAQPPNSWDREQTYFNIIRKINPDTVQGSSWDPNSVMHYPFGPGLIKEPVQYQSGLTPAGGLSARDAEWVKTFYPGSTPATAGPKVLVPLKSVGLSLDPGQQIDFELQPDATRDFEIRTFGTSDTVIVLFEATPSGPVYVAGDDDSGEDRNSYLKLRLMAGRRYVLRVRLYYEETSGTTALMYW